jgi:Protein of unknown function (DUF3592)
MIYKNLKTQAVEFLDNYKKDNPATYAAAQQAIGGLLILDGFVGIDNPLGGKKRTGIFGSLLGVVVGSLLVFGTSMFSNLLGINKLTANTTATVTSVSQPANTTSNNSNGGTCTPQASYTVDGQQFTQTSSSSSSSACSLTQGQVININYDPSNPGNWAYDLESAKTLLKIFPVVGGLIAATGLFTFIIRLVSILFGWKLLKSGRSLAKTLPSSTDLSTVKSEIKQNFTKTVFGQSRTQQTKST